jgi:hypothetical protein
MRITRRKKEKLGMGHIYDWGKRKVEKGNGSNI